MRHGNKVNHLGRTYAHRKALLSNLACSLITHKKITTTLAKAKELRVFVEPLLTKSKTDTTHSRRIVFAYLKQKEVVKQLFDEVSQKIASRQGGYTRILKIGNRPGDNAEMCIIELVDYNALTVSQETTAKAKTRRSRRRGGKVNTSEATASTETSSEENA